MKVRDEFPWRLQPSALVSIAMRDGVRLSGRLWLPELKFGETVPAIVDCHPYRLSDTAAVRDSRVYPYFAGHGYACLRVDLRGSGNSEGLLRDEYLAQEQEDNLDVIAWLAAQPWCTGSVGWIGTSWGGFAGLQVAALRPPALKAVVSICSTDDRYADDVHYWGGCLLATDMLGWASTMLMLNALPPDPDVVGDGWRAAWHERLEGNAPFVAEWLRHRLRDGYWRHGSVCEDFAAIEAPVFIVGGWSDGYVNAALRLLAGLRAPHKALVGPWSHGTPLEAAPGPNIGFLQECLRWWDRWLKGLETGVEADPDLRAWMQDPVPPAPSYAERPGRWLGLSWPLPVETRRWYLREGVVSADPGAGSVMTARGLLTRGGDQGAWCPGGMPGDWPGDQRMEDGAGITFTSGPLDDTFELLGNAMVELDLAVDQPRAEVVARLCDVGPGGESFLVTRGALDLTHREGHDRHVEAVPGQFVHVSMVLRAAAHRFLPGHRIRVSVSSAGWPIIWPSPAPVELSIRGDGASTLSLPVLAGEAGDRGVTAFADPEQARAIAYEVLDRGAVTKNVEHDVLRGEQRIRIERRAPTVRLPEAGGLEFASTEGTTLTIDEGDPLSARVTCANEAIRRRGAWDIRVETESELSATATHYLVKATARAFEGGTRVDERQWRFAIER